MSVQERCATYDEVYDPSGPRAKVHEHPEPQSGDARDAWIASGLPYERWIVATGAGMAWVESQNKPKPKSSPLVDKGCQDTHYLTPPKILEPVRDYFACFATRAIDLDPATEPDNPTYALRFYTEADDGLSKPWTGLFCNSPTRVFVNPPYGKELRAWVEKIALEARAGAHIVALLPGQRFEQAYWQRYVFTDELTGFVTVRSRIQFCGLDGKPLLNRYGRRAGNPYGSFLFVYNGTFPAMVKAFAPIGMVVERGRIAQCTKEERP